MPTRAPGAGMSRPVSDASTVSMSAKTGAQESPFRISPLERWWRMSATRLRREVRWCDL
jgi:hypothetical protein